MKKFPFYLFLAIATIGVISCNDDSNSYDSTSSSSSTAVTSFSLNADDDILENLDSVYFSIDLDKALIYNADSLPYGTDISRLLVTIGTPGCAAADLIITRENQSDTTINYLENSTDSIDFSNGPVTLHIVSLDLLEQRDYKIHVNVHQMKPDSLYWNKLARRNLPSLFSVPAEQKTVEFNDKIFCLTRLTSRYSMAVSENPGDDNATWNTEYVTFQFTPDLNSFSATDDALYILDENGNLYTSPNGYEWSACGVAWHHIYGGYETTLLGIEKRDNNYYHVTYPASESVVADLDFPISGTSQLLLFETKWSEKPQALMVGGKCYDGRLTGDTWAYDGSTWAKISLAPLPNRQNMTVIPYFSFKTDTDTWKVTEYSTLIAMLGENEGGETVKDVYISLDQGMHWSLADDLMQLPDYIPTMSKAQAFVFSKTLTRSANGSDWCEYEPKALPRWWSIYDGIMSRATAPITEWECPYIYLYGGQNDNGQTYNTVWRGVINRLSFKPVI